ncbi:putative MFS family arabinose efflux permease [Neorhizobium sp. R1-B]|jgi:predicted MFS family arabinose efflux permease|uniref:MFS transporter n=1 Tax=Neorhizobium sp. R1-B TaxID=2485162 RepID=UPI000DD71E7B|nr:MFS transporter [Neorhizobium sp. R1-B]TDX79653.1 putative MFS family arabinose efflux permease [Neorhizobium sp. R1-B]
MTSNVTSILSRHDLSGRREQFATRAVFLIAGLGMAAWAPLVPFAKARLAVGDAAFGLLLLCLGLGSIVAMPITGVLASKFGCRAVIAASSTLLAIGVPFLALANTPIDLALALAFCGASVGTLDVAINVQAVIVEKDSGRNMMSGFHGLFSLGGIVGAGGISLILGAGLSPFGATLIAGASMLILLVASYSGLLPYGNRDRNATPLFVLPRGIVILIGVLCFIVFLGEGSILDWSALFLISAHGLDQSYAGFGYSVFSITMTFGRLIGDWIVKTLGGAQVVFFGGLLSATGFLLAVVAPNASVALGGFALVGLGASNIVPVLFTAAGRQKAMPSSLAIAAVTTVGYAGILLGPALIGFVAQHFSLSTALVMLAGLLLVVALIGPRSAAP